MNNIHKPYLSVGGKPVFRRGGRVGCVCLHGFAAAPPEVDWFAAHMHRHLNMTTYTVRAAGHGTHAEDLLHLNWWDWYMSARDGYEILKQQCDVVFAAGISMGGLLALLLTAAADTDIPATVVMGSPVRYKSDGVQYAPYMWPFRPMMDMPDTTNLPNIIREEQARRGEPVIGRTHYKRWSTRATGEVYKLSGAVERELVNITTPLMLIYSQYDDVAGLNNIDVIREGVRSEVVESLVLTDGKHIVPQDVGREQAFAAAQAFLQRWC
ncbi:MAG: alpha/beta hydrolase [Phototrophicaceae bacterium]